MNQTQEPNLLSGIGKGKASTEEYESDRIYRTQLRAIEIFVGTRQFRRDTALPCPYSVIYATAIFAKTGCW
ncbi:hypothetical protein NDI37_08585 [Funiculus sociatus GB2-A5]|uniref:Uncharacterized protein n=1 Tax=Funiculus sociatus GB2-A5 TaxID=2933946 RepID=A0ABV0JM59_9CYAN|nr:hypothetical protein [Trichocoleus sp. FACHB-6]MBD2064649.1 hypothetical protein [Trichocoleus sp. FACHB-6]